MSVICAIVGAIAAVMNIGNKVTVNNYQSNNTISNQNGNVIFNSEDIMCTGYRK